MRLLANENFPLDAVAALRADDHDVAWIREDSRGIPDDKVLLDPVATPFATPAHNAFIAIDLDH